MLAVIIVNWNVRDLLRACLASLQQNKPMTHEQVIIVVDNASSDGSVEMLRREFPDVRLVVNATNRGYTGGNNDGLKVADEVLQQALEGKQVLPLTSYFLVLNPDTEMTPGTFDAMLAYADAHADVGVLGPQLRYPDGSLQSSKRHFPTLATTIFESTWLQKYSPHAVRDRYYARECADDETCDVDWLVGAALLVRRETYKKVGMLDEATFFMYSEEVDWCKRIKAAGWRVVYFPQAVIVHHEAKSSDQVSTRRLIYFNTSKVRYMTKHHGALQGNLARVALLTLFRWEWLIEAVKWVLGHKRPLRAERMKAYADVMKSGLV